MSAEERRDGGANAADRGVEVSHLTHSFPSGERVIDDLSMAIPPGSRCLLLGCNGAGKTTLLQLLAGKFMVPRDMVRVIGDSPFHDLGLSSSGALAYLGHQWRRSVASAGGDLPMQGDLAAEQLICNVPGVDAARRERLIKLLDINLQWRMHQVSDGQRRRVQICMGLLKPFQVLLLDEVTVDMDVLGRLELLRFFKQECEERGCVIVYATHIFDGLADWMTHVAFVSGGKLVRVGPASEMPELQQGKVLHTATKWLRAERDRLRAAPKAAPAKKAASELFGSRQMAFYR